MGRFNGKWIQDNSIADSKLNQIVTANKVAATAVEDKFLRNDGNDSTTGKITAAGFDASGQKITSVLDGVDATDAVTKGQLDSAVSGLSWKEPVDVRNLIGNATIAALDALTPSTGDAYLVTDAGTPSAGTSDSLAAGDIAEFDGTSWKKIVANSGGYAPSGTRAILSTSTALISPYVDGTDDGKIVQFDGTSNTGADQSEATEGAAVLIVDANDVSVYDDLGFVFEGAVPTGSWIQFTGVGQINAGIGLVKSGNTLNVGAGDGITGNADDIAVDPDSETGGNIQPVNVTANGVGVDISAVAGTGLEADGSANLRLAAQGNGIAGGAGSVLSVDPDSETGGNIQPVNVTLNGVGLDVNAIAGNGLAADGSANLDVDPDSETGGDIQPVNVTANGVGVDINAIAGTGLESDGAANLRLATQGNGIAGGNGSLLSVAPDSTTGGDVAPVSVGANGVGVDVTALDGDHLTVDFTPTNYTPDASVAEAADVDDLAAHLKGLDTAISGISTENIKQEMHLITASEVTAGYFTLSQNPVNAQSVRVTPTDGPMLTNKQVVGATGATPDFDVLNTNQVHINANGGSAGLSGLLAADDVVIIEYAY